jgi:membrane dipeptidase
MPDLVPVFDGHNDVLLRLCGRQDPPAERQFLQGTLDGHLDLPRARQGGLVGGLFAIFPPSPGTFDFSVFENPAGYDVPLPDQLPIGDARVATVAMAALLLRIERASDGAVAVCRSAAEIRAAIGRGALAAVMHIEGAEAVDPDFAMLDVLYEAGLRSIGPVWSRPNMFGHGVPFRFPSSPDTGPGLSDHGVRLVQACNRLKVMIDLSHLNEKGFWDVARLSDAPLVASHSNVHAICPTARNLTDRQLDAIRDSGGLVGLNFATSFLRTDGRMSADTGLDWCLRHLDAMIEALGEGGVALGSDFDGAVVPKEIGTAAGLPALIAAMRAHGYGERLIRRIACDNWVDVLERTIG